jgi:arylsulfatase A-like enzyme
LENLGLADNTIVVHTSDHGDMMGSHRMIAKQVMFQEAVQVPWLMRVPQLGRKQRQMRGPASHIHLVPTLLDLLGKPVNDQLPGRSLAPWFKGGPPAEDHAFIEWNMKTVGADGKPPDAEDGPQITSRAVVAPDGWKLSLNIGDKSQLFNLAKDPYEKKNLYKSGQHDDVVARLRDKIHVWQKSVNDTAAV